MDLTCQDLLSLIIAITKDELIDDLETLKEFLAENGRTTIFLEK